MEIKIYTDGACVGNPGPGGWAAVILIKNEKNLRDPRKLFFQLACMQFSIHQ